MLTNTAINVIKNQYLLLSLRNLKIGFMLCKITLLVLI
jgi:hypothetical protein